MPIEAGRQFGPYKILSLIGAGGMGEVYEARDVRLDRTVAIKVLSEHLSDDPDLKQRFEREAQIISSLNHPHICTLYDVGEKDGISFLVMEYLEGETLAQRLKKRGLPLDQALKYAIEVADALDKAHRQGVVHRDLKPGNIMLTKAGTKLLDFGLAKLRKYSTVGAEGMSAAPAESEPLTAEGKVRGTLPYMAPEQLESGNADARTDIFAFGAVIYEMVTGMRAFEATSQTSLITAIVGRQPPPMSARQPTVPRELEQLVARCLAKDPDERWQHAGDLAAQLRWIQESTSEAGPDTRTNRQASWRGIAMGLAVLVTAAVGATAWRLSRTESPSASTVTRFTVNLAPGESLPKGPGPELALSPDGTLLVYVGIHPNGTQLYVRRLDELGSRPLAGTEGASSPFFSPDASWIGFHSRRAGELRKIRVSGGPTITICKAPAASSSTGGTWGADGTIIFEGGVPSTLFRVSANGGTPEALTPFKRAPWQGEVAYMWPQLLPAGKHLLFTVATRPTELARRGQIVLLSLESGELRVIRELGDAVGARLLSTGHLVYSRFDGLWAVAFNLDSLQPAGTPSVVIPWDNPTPDAVVSFAVSDHGTIAYQSVAGRIRRSLVWVDRKGQSQSIVEDPAYYRWPRLSPDGRRLAFALGDKGGTDIWIHDFDRTTRTRLTFEGFNSRPAWAPDGQRLAFSSTRGPGPGRPSAFWTRADGGADAELLLRRPGEVYVGGWSREGQRLIYTEENESTSLDIWSLSIGKAPEPFLVTSFAEDSPTLSPGGRWLAYVSNESGRQEVYVRSFPDAGGKRLISTNGGREPVWSKTGQELFYRSLDGRQLMVVAIETEPAFAADTPRILFEGSYAIENTPDYDVTLDDRRFIMVKLDEQEQDNQILVTVNWLQELKRLVPR